MKPSIPSFLTLAGLALGAPAASAQTTPASPQEGAQPTQLATPVYAHVEVGPRAQLTGPQGEQLGLLQDFVVDRRSGHTLFAVVRIFPGDRAKAAQDVLVPPERFSWSERRNDLVLHASATELTTFPAFDPDQLQRLRDGSAAPGEKASPASAESGQDAERGLGWLAGAEMTEKGRNLLASTLLGASVNGTDGVFGKVTGLVLEPYEARIAFLYVGSGPEPQPGVEAKETILPWRAAKRLDDGRLVVPNKTVAELAQAPKLSTTRLKPLRSAETRDDIDDFYGLQHHAPKDGSSPSAKER